MAWFLVLYVLASLMVMAGFTVTVFVHEPQFHMAHPEAISFAFHSGGILIGAASVLLLFL